MVNFLFLFLVSMLFTVATWGALDLIAQIVNYVNKTSGRWCFFILLVFIYWMMWFCLVIKV